MAARRSWILGYLLAMVEDDAAPLSPLWRGRRPATSASFDQRNPLAGMALDASGEVEFERGRGGRPPGRSPVKRMISSICDRRRPERFDDLRAVAVVGVDGGRPRSPLSVAPTSVGRSRAPSIGESSATMSSTLGDDVGAVA